MQKKVLVDADCVTSLKELAKELADQYGWTSYEVAKDFVNFKAKVKGRVVNGKVELSGFAYEQKTGKRLEAFDVDFDECFDGWANHVWGEDEDGNAVMIHD